MASIDNQRVAPAENLGANPPVISALGPVEGAPVANRTGSLHVSDLKSTVTESTLFEFFRQVGEGLISNVRVCRDSRTNVSLGYGYVNFHNEADAERAMEAYNYEPIEGRACRISKTIRDPSVRKSPVGNLFIKNLDKSIDHGSFHDFFSSFGTILSCKLSTDRETGESRGYGFVHFADPAASEKAMESLNKKNLNGKEIFVGKFLPRNMRPTNATTQYTNLYLKNFSQTLTPTDFESAIKSLVGDCGEITSAKLMAKADTQASLGFGFVAFATHEAAAQALERLNNAEEVKKRAPEFTVAEVPLYCVVAQSKQKRQQELSLQRPADRNLYIKHFPDTYDDGALAKLFEEFGTITSAKVMINPDTKTSRGFGFVCFDNAESARQAITGRHQAPIENKPLYVVLAQPKAQRKQILATQYGSNMGFYPPGNPRFQRTPFPVPSRGAPRGMSYPNRPQYGPPSMYPQAPASGIRQTLLDNFQQAPTDDAKLQTAGDLLFFSITRAGYPEATARQCTGIILGNTAVRDNNGSVSNLGDALSKILSLCDDQNRLAEELNKIRQLLVSPSN